jgi:hypothetical protein
MPVILAIWRQRLGGLRFEASLGKTLKRQKKVENGGTCLSAPLVQEAQTGRPGSRLA